MPNRYEITPRTIILIALILVGGWLVVQVRDILELLFIAFILMSALRPIVDQLEKIRVPRLLSVLILYGLLFILLGIFGTIIFPPLISQTVRLLNNLPLYIAQVAPFVNINADTIFQQFAPLTQDVARVTVGVFSNLVTIVTLSVFTFYFLLERNNLRKFLDAFVGIEVGNRIIDVIHKIEERLGAWVRGQLLLGLIIGTASYIGLSLLHINYALPLAILAGILEMVPFIGPIISAVPSVLVALTVSPQLAVAVVALYFIIQQLENNLIVPLVMQRTVGLPPLASLLALMVGGRLAGIMGIILAVPILLVIQTVIQTSFTTSKKPI